LDDNDLVSEELLTAKFLDKEHIKNLHPLKGKEPDSTKEKKSNTPHKGIVGHTSKIGQFTSTVLAPPKPQKAQQMTTLPGSNNYWKEPKQLSPWLSKNSRQSADLPAWPYKQVRFLLLPYRKERYQPQSYLEPEPQLPAH